MVLVWRPSNRTATHRLVVKAPLSSQQRFGKSPMDRFFTAIATRSATIMGQPLAFILSTLFIILWAVSGPFLNYSDTWQLIVNTATTVLTFLAVFLIQNSQNRDGAAMQAKLNEIIRALD